MKNKTPGSGSSNDQEIKNIVLDDEKAILLDHNYDGIEELDNPLPKWWLLIFYGTIVFSAFYYGYYEFGGGPSLRQELESDLAAIRAMGPSPAEVAKAIDFGAGTSDPGLVSSGKVVFAAKCVACHGDYGQGLVGPNLTDHFWISGDGSLASIAKTVAEGVAEKGMPPWGAVISADDLKSVTVYVATLKDTKPANPKAPQGNEVK